MIFLFIMCFPSSFKHNFPNFKTYSILKSIPLMYVWYIQIKVFVVYNKMYKKLKDINYGVICIEKFWIVKYEL